MHNKVDKNSVEETFRFCLIKLRINNLLYFICAFCCCRHRHQEHRWQDEQDAVQIQRRCCWRTRVSCIHVYCDSKTYFASVDAAFHCRWKACTSWQSTPATTTCMIHVLAVVVGGGASIHHCVCVCVCVLLSKTCGSSKRRCLRVSEHNDKIRDSFSNTQSTQ